MNVKSFFGRIKSMIVDANVYPPLTAKKPENSSPNPAPQSTPPQEQAQK